MDSIDYTLVGQKIKQLRSQRSLTQDGLAELCNVSTSYLGHIERGTRKLSLETAYKIAACLHISLDSLIIDGLTPDDNIMVNVQAIIKKQEQPKRDSFIRIVKLLAENIDEL